MLSKKLVSLFLFCASWLAWPTYAQEVIFIEAEIYDVPQRYKSSELPIQLKHATLDSAPQLMTALGQSAVIEIGLESEEGQAIDMMKMTIETSKKNNNFALEFKLSRQDEQSISRVVDNSFGQTLVLSSTLKGTVTIAKVKTTKFDNLALAQAARQQKTEK
ncbi:hypothetical protein [Psychrobium sp. 1_MG-2023]|uniref:hypothetical protein n=1 Tax=Psychrobium sp. 1_MG-2023 TaxID=3062624 RepID=UPI000C330DF2|nr:hypothetical protein [Psychrobium sp. 1_MG-2023]MDP2561502.1 hypothetical protein [Psychrobium sp. 1_MG-2023]PKF57768.1 hypothetical protein CW748_06115 [Alteromonadales bacterium alter-6D02]